MKSQKERIRAHLEQGKRLTQGEALQLFGTSRLAARISDLRESGLDILTDIIEVSCVDGHKANVAQYYLMLEIPETLF